MLEQIENIRIKVSKGETEIAIDDLSILTRSSYPQMRNDVLILSSRLGTENRNRRLGIDFDKKEIAQINLGILEILDTIEEGIRHRAKNLEVEIEGEEPIGNEGLDEKEEWEKFKEGILPLLEHVKDLIIESMLLAKVDVTKIRAALIDENFIFWEMVVSDDSKYLNEDEGVLSKILYNFYKNELNVMNFTWGSELISFHVYLKDRSIGFFELKRGKHTT